MDAEQAWSPDIVIYHDHCADGFGAAWACWMRWKDACTYIPASYGAPPPDVAGKNVLIVDFSYKEPVLRAMAETAHAVVVLGHHKTAEADLFKYQVAGDTLTVESVGVELDGASDTEEPMPLIAFFDMNRSGARLAWDFCHGDLEAPLLIRLIEDRDLWRFTMEDTKPFSLWLRSEPFDFERFAVIGHELENVFGADQIMTEARAMQRFADAKVEEIASFAKLRRIGAHEPIVVNCPPMFASEVGHALLDKHPEAPFAATYFDGPTARMWSLRSRDDRKDVSAIAAKFGGGGHRNAAGFGTPLP